MLNCCLCYLKIKVFMSWTILFGFMCFIMLMKLFYDVCWLLLSTKSTICPLVFSAGLVIDQVFQLLLVYYSNCLIKLVIAWYGLSYLLTTFWCSCWCIITMPCYIYGYRFRWKSLPYFTSVEVLLLLYVSFFPLSSLSWYDRFVLLFDSSCSFYAVPPWEHTYRGGRYYSHLSLVLLIVCFDFICPHSVRNPSQPFHSVEVLLVRYALCECSDCSGLLPSFRHIDDVISMTSVVDRSIDWSITP